MIGWKILRTIECFCSDTPIDAQENELLPLFRPKLNMAKLVTDWLRFKGTLKII